MKTIDFLKRDFRGVKGWQWILIAIAGFLFIITSFMMERNENKVYAVGDTFSNGIFNVSVTEVDKKGTLPGIFIDSQAKGMFVIVKVAIDNTSKEKQYVGPGLFSLVDEDGNKYDSQSAVFKETTLNPKSTTTGTIIFDIPRDSKGTVVTVYRDYFGNGNGKKVDLNL